MWFLILLLLCTTASADVYVITDKNNAVYDISNQPDAVVPKDYNRVILQGKNIQDLQIIPPYQNYNYSNGAFTLNTAAVQAYNAQQVAQANAATAQEQAKESAIAKLTDAISKVATQDVLTEQELQAILPGN